MSDQPDTKTAAQVLGAKGGSSKSAAKQAASRRNGKLGGRPKSKAECDGGCKKCRPPIVRVSVRDADTKKDWGTFNYCQTAIKTDQKEGLLVKRLK